MTEREWLTSDNPAAMLAYLAYLGGLVTDQQLRAWVEACRAEFNSTIRLTEWGNTNPIYVVSHWSNSVAPRDVPFLTRAALLREVVGNPFRPVGKLVEDRREYHGEGDFTVHWRRQIDGVTERARDIATQIDEDAAWDKLPMLHDLLVEAGCDNDDLLQHLLGQERCPWCFDQGDTVYGLHTVVFHRPHCDDTGRIPLRHPHVRGCWALAAIRGE